MLISLSIAMTGDRAELPRHLATTLCKHPKTKKSQSASRSGHHAAVLDQNKCSFRIVDNGRGWKITFDRADTQKTHCLIDHGLAHLHSQFMFEIGDIFQIGDLSGALAMIGANALPIRNRGKIIMFNHNLVLPIPTRDSHPRHGPFHRHSDLNSFK